MALLNSVTQISWNLKDYSNLQPYVQRIKVSTMKQLADMSLNLP